MAAPACKETEGHAGGERVRERDGRAGWGGAGGNIQQGCWLAVRWRARFSALASEIRTIMNTSDSSAGM